MTAAEPETDRYKELVDALLRLDSVDDIRSGIRASPWVDVATLRGTLATLQTRALDRGRPAERDLLTFLATVVEEILAEGPWTATWPETTPEVTELVDAALNADSTLGVLGVLRARRRLLSAELYKQVEAWFVTSAPSGIHRLPRLRLVCVLALQLGGHEHVGKAHLFWAAHARSTGDYAGAERHLVRAAGSAAAASDPFLAVAVASAKAALYDDVGDSARAADAYQTALHAAEQLDQALTVPLRHRLAGCLRSLGRYSQALTTIEEVISESRKAGSDEYELRGRLLKGLLLEDLGDYERGSAEYQLVQEAAKAAGNRQLEFQAMNNGAASLLKRGSTREGLNRFRDILLIVQTWGDRTAVASAHNNLGHALLQAGRPGDARVEHVRALALGKASGAPLGMAISLLGIGDAHAAVGGYEEAANFWHSALVNWVESGDLSILAMVASRFEGPEEDMDEEMASLVEHGLAQARSSELGRYEAQLVPSLIDYYARNGKSNAALRLARETIARAETRNSRAPEVLRLKLDLARLLAARPDGAREAFQLLSATIASVEERILDVALDRRKSETVGEWVDLYEGLIDLLLDHDDASDLLHGEDPSVVAFELHESAKARTFVTDLAHASFSAPDTLPEELRDTERRLLALRQSLQEAAVDEIGSEMYRLQRLHGLGEQLQACWDSMRTAAPEYVRMRAGKPAGLDDLRALLPRSGRPMAMVSFLSERDRTICFVLRSDEPGLAVLRCPVGRAAIANAAGELRRTFNGDPRSFPPRRPIQRDRPWGRNLSFLEDLSERLLGFLDLVEGVELLCIAPHGPLHLIPIHALRDPGGTYVAERFAVTYCPSLTTLRYCIMEPTGRPGARSHRTAYVAGIASSADDRPEFFEEDVGIFDTRRWEVTADLGPSQASRVRILENLRGHDVVHLTCHGFFEEGDPLQSGLLVSDGSGRPPRELRSVPIDRRSGLLLTAKDFLQHRMGADLVTLRACSTGLQVERNAGDEFEGLTRSLLYAGNASVMTSLWNVDQRSSQELLRRFYRLWRGNGTPIEKARALWKAQQSFLSGPDGDFLRHPYHWAPLVLSGDWR
jgi:tetratricopeptide (TPR) repeat protein